jgi:hypothetical protein
VSRDFIGIFETKVDPSDQFGESLPVWEEVCREWVSIKPQPVITQRGEFIDAAQTKGMRKSVVECVWSETLDAITTANRMKVARRNVVNANDPDSDDNFRIFQIEQIVNDGEMNRDLQFVMLEQISGG